MLVDLLVDDLLPLLGGPVVAALVLPIHILPRVNEVAAVVVWVTLAHVSATHRKVQIFLLRRLCVGVRALLVIHRRRWLVQLVWLHLRRVDLLLACVGRRLTRLLLLLELVLLSNVPRLLPVFEVIVGAVDLWLIMAASLVVQN